MVRKKKSTHHTIEKNDIATRVSTVSKWKDAEVFKDFLTGNERVLNHEMMKAVVMEMKEYLMNEPRCLKIRQYLRVKGIPEKTYYMWVEKYDWFKEHHHDCMLILADKREVGASFRELDRDMQLRVLHMYDPEWLAINKYHSDMKKEEQSVPTQFSIDLKKPDIISAEEMKHKKEE